MRKLMVAGNWKMNGTKQSASDLLTSLRENEHVMSGVDVAVFPPYILLDRVEHILSGSAIGWGAQNVDMHPEGAFTGEISARMLRDFGCRYVLIGHSERRSLYHESYDVSFQKYHAAIAAGLTPIFCVGETLKQREQGDTYSVLHAQLFDLLMTPEGIASLKHAVIAYEPVWAIGTGRTASPEMAQEVHKRIRSWIGESDKTIADNIRILYGGSVNAGNAKALFAMPDIDGGLIGGASLKAHDFLGIVISCNNF